MKKENSENEIKVYVHPCESLNEMEGFSELDVDFSEIWMIRVGYGEVMFVRESLVKVFGELDPSLQSSKNERIKQFIPTEVSSLDNEISNSFVSEYGRKEVELVCLDEFAEFTMSRLHTIYPDGNILNEKLAKLDHSLLAFCTIHSAMIFGATFSRSNSNLME